MVKISSLLENSRLLFYLLLFLIFGVYLATISPTVSFGDSGDLVTAAFELGVPHPPGYPLHTLLGKLFTLLIPFGEMALRVNLVSLTFSLLTSLIIYAIIHKQTRSSIAAFLGASFLAFSSGFWTYSVVTDVFALNAFFASLLIFLILEWHTRITINNFTPRSPALPAGRLGEVGQQSAISNPFPSSGILLLFAFIFGLSLTNHLTIVFLLPAFLLLILSTVASYQKGETFNENNEKVSPFKKFFQLIPLKVILLGLVLFLVGLLPYLYLIPAASHNPLVNWDNPKTWYNAEELSGLKRILLRSDYGTGRWTSSTASVLPSGKPAIFQVLFFTEITLHQFAFVGVALLLLGIIALIKAQKFKDLIFWLTIFLLPSLGFMLYTNLSYTDSAALSALERFLLMPYLGAAVLIGFGAQFFIAWLKNRVPQTPAWSLLFLVIIPIALHFPNVTQAKNYLFYDYGKIVFDSVQKVAIKKADQEIEQPKKALLITKGDLQHFMADYIEGVQNKYPSVYVLNMEMLTYPWYVSQAKIRYPDLKLPFKSMDGKTGFFFDLIAANIDNFRVYVPQMKYQGLEPTFAFLPVGVNFWVIRDSWKTYVDRQDFIKINEEIFANDSLGKTLTKKVPTFDFYYPWTWWKREVVLNYSVFLSNLGTTFQQNGWNELAVPYFEKALSMAPDLVAFETHFNLAVAYQALGKFDSAIKEYTEAQNLNPDFADTYKNMGIVYQTGLADKEKAILNYEKFVQLSTNEKEKAKVQGEIEKLRKS